MDRDPKVSKSPCKIDYIHQNDSIVASRARAVATKITVNMVTQNHQIISSHELHKNGGKIFEIRRFKN